MKKALFGLLAGAALLAGTVVPSFAGWQQGGWHGGHGGWHGGWRSPVVWVGPRVVIGGPAFYYPRPYVYPRPFVYAPPVVVAAPPVVVASPPVAAVAAPAPPAYSESSQYWYYCQNPAGYYPSVPQCPSGWLQVAPQPQ